MGIITLTEPLSQHYRVESNALAGEMCSDSRRRVAVEIGDTKRDVFYPQVKLCHWDNEVNFSARLLNTETQPVVTTKDERLIWSGEDMSAVFYDRPADSQNTIGGYEFEVILNSPPKDGRVQFSIQTKGLDFIYQPPLTRDEIARGLTRPPNVDGSYVVYYRHPGNVVGGKLYGVGKAFAIYRPYCIDAVGRTVWADLKVDIASELMTIQIPLDWLEKATYPIVVDPTFGVTTKGTTYDLDVSSMYAWCAASCAEAGTLTAINAWMAVTGGGSASAKVGVYTNNVNVPDALVDDSSGSISGSTETDYQFTSGVSASVSATYYWLIAVGSSSNAYVCADYYGSAAMYRNGAYADFPPSSAGTTYTNNWILSVYATYSTGGGGGLVIPVAMHHYRQQGIN